MVVATIHFPLSILYLKLTTTKKISAQVLQQGQVELTNSFGSAEFLFYGE